MTDHHDTAGTAHPLQVGVLLLTPLGEAGEAAPVRHQLTREPAMTFREWRVRAQRPLRLLK